MAEDVKIPGEPEPTSAPLLKNLTLLASALTAASIAVNLVLQIAHFAKKKPVQPDQRDKVQGATLALTVLKTLPGLIKQSRIFANHLTGKV